MPSEENPPKTSPSSRERGGVGRVTMDPPGLYMYVTPDAALMSAVTATEQHFILGHHGIARCSEKTWTLNLTDAGGSVKTLSLAAIRAMPAREVCTALECAGNPEDPDRPSRIVSNAVWRGPTLRSLLALMPARAAAYVWSSGVDWGGYAGEATDDYVKDMPIAKAMDDEVIVAYEMNGAPLPPEHGFPLRLVVPGYYGTNSVKWLAAISLHNERPRSLFTTRLYNDWRSGEPVPVWEMAVNSKLLAPAAGASLPLGAVDILGRAWGHAAIKSVELSVDGGASWFDAELDPAVARYAWRTFRARWMPPGPGRYEIAARAGDVEGRLQPEGLHINQIQRVPFVIV